MTWVYDGTSFTPVAKVTDGERYTIVHDYLGTPTQAYNSKGELVWEMLLDVYGKVAECHGDRTLVPFRYQGQYEDEETGLYYNRFRYYSPDMGMYISSDPIGLAGNNPTLYGYVQDVNTWMDPWGLDCSKDAQKLRANMIAAGKVEPPYPNAAHHIVLSNSNDWRMVSLRGKMEAFGIDINDADNGIFLPRSSSVKEQFAIDEIAHSRVHTEQYKQSIYDILSPTKSEEEFRQKLKSIRF
ncbi:Bacteriodales T6SS Rhs protein [Phocaeicola vulgatus]|nr:Bacteriodales T6SS Rhs protein [Phocaeicola vulgatus]